MESLFPILAQVFPKIWKIYCLSPYSLGNLFLKAEEWDYILFENY